jgi:hypothetical protein
MTNSTFTIKYQVPYPSVGLIEEWRTQSFNTMKEAQVSTLSQTLTNVKS